MKGLLIAATLAASLALSGCMTPHYSQPKLWDYWPSDSVRSRGCHEQPEGVGCPHDPKAKEH